MSNVFKNHSNQLKNMIYLQENKPFNEQTIKSLFRSIVEPVLDKKAEGLVLFRLEEKSKNDFSGILKRFEHACAQVYDFSKTPINDTFENVLKEDIWEKTEFVYVLTKRFGVAFIFDYEVTDIDDSAGIYLLYNSKSLSETFKVINENSQMDLSAFNENLHPERRDNDVLNDSIMSLVDIINETNREFLFSEIEKENIEDGEDLASRLDFLSKRSSYVSHEIRNQLSICDLYSTIIEKHFQKLNIEDESAETSIKNALNCIQKSLKMANASLMDLKSLNNSNLKNYELEYLIKTSVELARVYINEKDININYEVFENPAVIVDENKFLAVLINLIKNAVEVIDDKGEINISAKIEDEEVKIVVSNNGKPISKELQEKIYEEGFTTKSTGSGLGLYLCKKSLEEQFAQLKLKKSDDVSTDFEISLPQA